MNRRKTIQRYQRLHNSQWYKDYPSKPNKNHHIIKSCRMLIAARKRVPPWHGKKSNLGSFFGNYSR